MLITKERVVAAMNLTPAELQATFHRTGYESEMVRTATYRGMTANGSFSYRISYNGDDNVEDADCYVYFNMSGEMLVDY